MRCDGGGSPRDKNAMPPPPPQVYVALALTTAVSAAGAYTDVVFHVGGILSSILAFASMFYVLSTDAYTTAAWKRRAALASYAFCMGTSVGPLVGLALDLNPALLVTALGGTAASFACFSTAALVTKRRWARTAVKR